MQGLVALKASITGDHDGFRPSLQVARHLQGYGYLYPCVGQRCAAGGCDISQLEEDQVANLTEATAETQMQLQDNNSLPTAGR